MKKFSSLLVAIVVILTMVSTVAFAADPELYLSDVTYGGSGNITVSILCNTSYDAEAAEVYGYFNYDPELFTLVSEPAGCYDDGGCIEVWLEPVTSAVVADEAIVTFEFIPNGDVVGYTFVMEEAALLSDNNRLFSENISTTVKAAAQEEVVDATVVEENADAVVYGAENSYWGVWVGTYKVALNGKTLQSAVVTFEGVDGKSFPTQNTNWAEGEGEATFKIAIIGVPDEYADKSVAKATLK